MANILIRAELCMASKSYLLRICLVHFIFMAYNLVLIMLAVILQINTHSVFLSSVQALTSHPRGG
jgi:hypothetical protein